MTSLIQNSSRLFALRKAQWSETIIVMEQATTKSEIDSIETSWTEGTELTGDVLPEDPDDKVRNSRLEADMACVAELDWDEGVAEGIDEDSRLKWRGLILHVHGFPIDWHKAGEIMRLTCTATKDG